MRYYILDDDLASRKMLSRIISEEFLGEVIGESSDAMEAEMEIISNYPDIVLIDLLMPNQDGIETVQNLNKRNFKGKFIMISQIVNKEMVAKAYREGIEYFIHKPINRVEVSFVIRKVMDQIKMERSLNKIKESLDHLQPAEKKLDHTVVNIHTSLQQILGDLGILGESGSNDLMEIIDFIYHSNQYHSFFSENMSLKDIYQGVLETKGKEVPSEKELKAFEQRIRRTVNQAMINLASLGLTDYAHPKFEHYATKFFDFNEIRLKMRELDKEDGVRAARINLKKFIHALYNEMTSRLE